MSFEVERGEVLAIVGESGCGKSVTARSIMALIQAPQGEIKENSKILYNGEDILTYDKKKIREFRGGECSMIFQDALTSLNPTMKVGKQIIENLVAHRNMDKKSARKEAIRILDSVGIPNAEKRVDQYPHEFSGGMRQRVMIAIAVACNPKILIADEPTTALDVTIQAQIFELMNNLKKDHDTAILLITHDMGVVAELADEVAVMYMGNIIESGDVSEVLKTPAHPYTEALLKSIPVLGKGRTQELHPIKGSTPDPFDRPIGCQFAPRCDYACEKCNEMPGESMINGTHMVRCWNHKEVMNNGSK